jgi:A/G-specific adenine glycosylase
MITSRKKQAFQKKVLLWYSQHKRDLPWRKTKDPYAILVSEIMLQQTQVSRVVDYYYKFMKRFPDLLTLSRARKRTLLTYWSGLGYNNRVLRLQLFAREILKEHDDVVPNKEEELLLLPGIGPYTAGAIMAFAFNISTPVIDTNIRRVLISAFNLDEDIQSDILKQLANDLIPPKKSRIWHNALMDYGALVLTARKTGIKSLSKQGKFEGSDRWVRGSLVKMGLQEKNLTLSSLKKQFDNEQLLRVVEKMKEEKILIQKGSRLLIA